MDNGEGAERPFPQEPTVLTTTELTKVAAMVGTNHAPTTTADYASNLTKYKVKSWVLLDYLTIILTVQHIFLLLLLSVNNIVSVLDCTQLLVEHRNHSLHGVPISKGTAGKTILPM